VLDLQAFLVADRLEVLDIVPGAVPGTRRLLVGDPTTARTTHVVALASGAAGLAALESEIRHLDELAVRLRPAIWATVPTVVSGISLGEDQGAVLSAVAGAGSRRPRPQPRSIPGDAIAIGEWLTALWDDTAGTTAPLDLGGRAVEVLTATLAGASSGADTLEMLDRSRSALSDFATARTSTHGCLCPQHVWISDGRVAGVDDWGLGSSRGEPLRDLGNWVVTSAGARVCEVLVGRSKAARSWRDLIVDGLAYLDIPDALWRDVLLLCLAEAAVAGLAADDGTSLDLLTSFSRELFHTVDRRSVNS
jgi:hypothetical protein